MKYENNKEAEQANITAVRKYADILVKKYRNGDKVAGTAETIAARLELDPKAPYIDVFRPFKFDYLEKEHDWYLSQDLSIHGYMDDIKIWQFCASKDDKQEINSNYGYLVYNAGNYSQFEKCLEKLVNNKDSREAMIIFTRPSIHIDATANGKHDFICTNYYHFFIRDNQLDMILSQRSCDIVTGFPYDYAWACHVFNDMLKYLNMNYDNEIKSGKIIYNIDSLHIYERSEKLVNQYQLSD